MGICLRPFDCISPLGKGFGIIWCGACVCMGDVPFSSSGGGGGGGGGAELGGDNFGSC